jgi:predicted nucleic acid-binding protein
MGSSLVNLTDKLKGINRLGIDSVIIIYLIEKNPKYLEQTIFLAEQITQGEITAISSSLLLTEVLVKPLRDKDSDLVSSYQKILQNSQNFYLVNLTPTIAYQTAELRANYNIKPPDAVHIATAIESGCQAFLTNDRGIARVKEIEILILDDLLD